MSAFIVRKDTMHACALALSAAGEDLTTFGRELYAMNEDAVAQRYSEEPDRTGSTGYVWESPGPLSPGGLLEALECLRYQCAEGDVPERPLFERLSVAVEERRQERPVRPSDIPRPMLSVGEKYQPGLDVADIAKLVRADIKTAIAAGELPQGMKVSVTIERYSMGRSLNVRVTACPGPIVEWSTRTEFSHPVRGVYFTASVVVWLDCLQAIVRAYSRREVDSQTDYYNVNFSDDVAVAWELRHAAEDALGPDPEALPALRVLPDPEPASETEPNLVEWLGLEAEDEQAPAAVSDDPWSAWISREVSR